jgi:ribonuclease E
MKKEMLINVLQPEEIRIAIVEDGVLEELYVERTSHESYVGNIYKGRIVNIEPSIQAAFVDFGVGRNGFLHVSDVEPAYYRHLEPGRDGGRRSRDRDRGDRGERGDRDRGGRGQRRARSEPQEDSGRMPEEAVEDAFPGDQIETVESVSDEDRVEEYQPSDDVVDVAAAPYQESSTGEEEEAKPALADQAPLGEPEPTRDDAAPEADTETRPSRGRRRGRGRGRGRRQRGDKAEHAQGAPEQETSAAEGTVPPEPGHDASAPKAESPPAAESKETPPPRDWPRLMESAEHHTTEGSKSSDDLPDEELSFSMRPPKEPQSEQGHGEERPVERHAEERYAEERYEEERYTERREEAPPFASELERQEAAGARAPFLDEIVRDFDAPGAGPEQVPDASESPHDALERAFDEPEEEPAPRFEEEDDDFPPRRQGPRDDRRGDRRHDRRGGGRRDDRRSGPRRGPMGRPGMGKPKPLIQDIFKRGQEVLVQVIKEGIGTKGPTLSTYISIAGRYLVLMPGLNRIGVSRKIIDEEARRRLREILHELEPPKGLGFIIRTAGIDRNKKELQRDLAYLSRLWQVVVRRIKKTKSPCEIYQESDMITRTIRDIFTSEIDSITVDESNAFEHAKEFLQIVMPRYASRINFYDSTEPMFHRYGIETEIARIQQRHVPLPAGGSIVIDQTEALVAIDVNSGNFRADNNAEETAYQMNLQAAKEIARQLRLRDLGGVIVNDFIDMREDRHRRGVEKAMRDAVKRDRARTKVLKISQFGIIEMTRQRIRPSLKRSVYQDCPHCLGTGQIKTCESMSIDVMRFLQLATHREHVKRIEIRVHEDVALYLLNRKRKEVAQLESAGDKLVNIKNTPGVSPEFLEFLCFDAIDNEVKFMPYEEPMPRRNRNRR